MPVTGILMLLPGAIFGFQVGWAGSIFTSTIGATIVFLWSRYLFRERPQNRFKNQFKAVNRGLAEEGFYYLFSVRLLMVLPFFMVNTLHVKWRYHTSCLGHRETNIRRAKP